MTKALFIDMAGVLMQVDWQANFSAMLGRQVEADDLHRSWAQSKAVLDFEHGRSDFEAFLTHFSQEYDINMSKAQLARHFLAILTQPFEQAHEVLNQLKQHHQLYLLSNTNSAHLEHHLRPSGLLDHFDQCFLSCELQMMKPDEAFFLHALEVTGLRPQQVAFFDDGLSNVLAAQALGMRAHRVFAPEQILHCLMTEPH